MSNEENINFENLAKQMSNEKLCEIIVTNRYLGLLKEQSIISMKELANRRANGNNFNYEDFIESEFKKLPKIIIEEKTNIKKIFKLKL